MIDFINKYSSRKITSWCQLSRNQIMRMTLNFNFLYKSCWLYLNEWKGLFPANKFWEPWVVDFIRINGFFTIIVTEKRISFAWTESSNGSFAITDEFLKIRSLSWIHKPFFISSPNFTHLYTFSVGFENEVSPTND